MVSVLDEDYLQSITNLTEGEIKIRDYSMNNYMNSSIQFPESAYVSGYRFPALKHMRKRGNGIYFPNSSF